MKVLVVLLLCVNWNGDGVGGEDGVGGVDVNVDVVGDVWWVMGDGGGEENE